MAGVRVELLLALSGTLLLVSVSGWTPVDPTQLLRSYNMGQLGEPAGGPDTVDSSDYDEYDDSPAGEGAATSENSYPYADYGFRVGSLDADSENWDSITDGEFETEYGAPPRSWPDESQFPYSSGQPEPRCPHAKPAKPANPPKPANPTNPPKPANPTKPPKPANPTKPPKPANPTKPPKPANPTEPSEPFPPVKPSPPVNPSPPVVADPTMPQSSGPDCAVAMGERVTCGQSGISSSDCQTLGCCVDSFTSACYYPLDVCTSDQYFVFAIRYDSAPIPVDPTKLVIPGNPNCKPVIANDKVAIFKFKVTECGTHSYEVGEAKIYLTEVQTAVLTLNLKYGVITRTDPLRFMVECRYSKCSAQKSMASVGYMVKTPNSALPSLVSSQGLYGVELRIANDSSYSSYLPSYHQPLRLLLKKPVYLELRLKSPKPDAVIIVNYCLAYPRSAKNALVLVYEECANPYDPNVSILQVSDLPTNRHQRRFVVNAFQFMDLKTNKYLDEEICFMCSTEVCQPDEKPCVERCFDGKAP